MTHLVESINLLFENGQTDIFGIFTKFVLLLSYVFKECLKTLIKSS